MPIITGDAICTFCGKDKDECEFLAKAKSIELDDYICICDKCLTHIIDTSTKKKKPKKVKKAEDIQTKNQATLIVPTPQKIKEFLDDYVVGQDEAKVVLSVAVYNHYKRILNNKKINRVDIDKSNVLIIGPSGTGKTLLASSVAKILKLPISFIDATSLTESGYMGDDVDIIIEKLISAAGGDIELAQMGIVFIDEIDKKSKKSDNAQSRDVSGEGVQYALLRMIEGTKLNISVNGVIREFDTSNVLFISGGAFEGLSDVVANRIKSKKSSIGFGGSSVELKQNKELYKDFNDEDLITHGLIPEFIGRFPVKVALNSLTEDMIVKILTEPKNNIILQYKEIFKLDGITLEFEDGYIHSVAKLAMEQKTGARGLRTILEKHLLGTQFTLPTIRTTGIDKIIVKTNGDIVNVAEQKKGVKKRGQKTVSKQ